jgi:lipopolysaccharide transport system ATP-binding protein
MTPVISARRLGKRYRVGARPRHRTLADSLRSAARPSQWLRRRVHPAPDMWAIRDASFDVAPGEVVGVIGRNGAGKSTLLKVLARITDPTEGSARLEGRVGSLLEVGTGFHQELTGRENIYLNGAILGMHTAEIDRCFDDIVAFAETGRFIDTPIKHFSTGMSMRLAFAVAAHLKPDILIVDEVLAVGDGAFQRKCMGRMHDAAHDGRTVLFVSHNMDAVRRLCTRVLLLQDGRVVADGDPASVIASYLEDEPAASGPGQAIDLAAAPRAGSGEARFLGARYTSANPDYANHAYPDGPLTFILSIESDAQRVVDSMAVRISASTGTRLIHADTMALGERLHLRQGQNTVTVGIRQLHLTPGTYEVGLRLGDWWGRALDHLESAFTIDVVDAAAPGFGVMQRSEALVSCDFHVTPDQSIR